MLYEVLKDTVERFPERPAIVCNGKTWSYSQLLLAVQGLADALYDLGVGNGSQIAVLSDNRPEFVFAFFALAKLNALMIPVNTSYSENEIRNVFEVCGVKLVLCDVSHKEVCEAAISSIGNTVTLISLDAGDDAAASFNGLRRERTAKSSSSFSVQKAGTDDFIVLFSSGSTGRPKRMVRTQSAYVFEMKGFISISRTVSDDRLLCAIPLFHSHGIGSCLLPTVGSGACLVMLEQNSKQTGSASAKDLFVQKLDRVYHLIKANGITIFPAIPYIFQAILDDQKVPTDLFDGVRLCFSSGNFLPNDLYVAFLSRFGVPIRQIYGCSEAGAISIDARPRSEHEIEGTHLSSGMFLPGTLARIIDENGNECTPNEVGEVVVCSPSLTAGYIDYPELTKEAFINGYFKTGDLGRIDNQGVLTLTGRKKLLIDTGGKKVDPFEVQDVIKELSQVSEVVVLGVPAVGGNEWIKAVIVSATHLEPLQVIEHCKRRLATYKVPRIIEFRDNIPKSATGKILRKDLLNEDDVAKATLQFLIEIINRSTDATMEIDEQASFESLGVDSVTMAELNKVLEKHFSHLPKTLFFEHRTVGELSAYLFKNHLEATKEAVRTLVGNANRNDDTGKSKNADAAIPAREEAGDIAIIGVSGQYPGAGDLQQFWDNLVSGTDSIVEIPPDRWDWRSYFDKDPEKIGASYSKWGGFIDGVFEFDASLFAIPPVEAETIDPQERLFLTNVWRTLEDAGYSKDDFEGNADQPVDSVGVYVGVMWGDYQLFSMNRPSQMEEDGNLTKSHYWSLANRVSYFFNFKGPSLAVDTACSSSLTAIHLACQAIRNGECNLAIAGGVNLILHPRRYQLLCLGKYASTDGRCRSFGEGGDGYVPAEGVGAVLLKPLREAVRNRDNIYGVIKGTAINHGGSTKAYTVPDPHAQKGVIRKALENANVSSETISYIEAHGTGTSLGDPIEIRGLSLAFDNGPSERESRRKPCAIGSLKSNIGHAEAAAGIAGLTKVLLQMKHQKLVPSLHAEQVNPNIQFENSPFFLQKELAEWGRENGNGLHIEVPRRAAISSFGAGGSNAHLVIEEYQQAHENGVNGESRLFLFSAMSEERLMAYAMKWREAIGIDGDSIRFMGSSSLPELRDVAYTLRVGRMMMRHRLAVIASGWAELRKGLSDYIAGTSGEKGNVFAGKVTGRLDSFRTSAVPGEKGESHGAMSLESAAAQWVEGNMNWNAPSLDEGRRVSLPTYPFSRETYRVPSPEFGSKGRRVTSKAEREEEPIGAGPVGEREKIVLTKQWRETPPDNVSADISGVVIILGTALTLKLSATLLSQVKGVRTITVIHEPKGSGVGGDLFGDFYSVSGGELLFAEVERAIAGETFAGVIDVTAFDERYEKSSALESGKIRLLQLLVERNRQEGFFLLQATFRLMPHGMAASTLQGARSAGLYRMLGSEYRKIRSAVMDTDCPIDHRLKLARQIEAELKNLRNGSFTECCYRHNVRYLPYLNEENASSYASVSPASAYDDKDVIVITGGTRGIGRAVASHLADSGVKNLVLLGREELPKQAAWDDILDGDPERGLFEKLSGLKSLSDRGVKLHYSNVPLTDIKGLRSLIRTVSKELGPITGVFHCAGLVGDATAFFGKNVEQIEAVCNPKMSGLVNLANVLSGSPLRFFKMFSSLASLVPTLGTGHSDYSMANSFMDFFAAYQKERGQPSFQAIQWAAWGETGMSSDDEKRSSTYSELGFEYFSTREGIDFLDSIINSEPAVVCPCIVDRKRFNSGELLNAVMARANAVGISTTAGFAQEKRQDTMRSESVRRWLRDIFKSELKIADEQLDEDKPFSDYGIESVLLAQLTQTIRKQAKISISPSLLLENDNISQLVDYFEREHGGDWEARKEDVSHPELAEPEATRRVGGAGGDIAVVGISCRFPGSKDKEAFWSNLVKGTSAITPVSTERWVAEPGRMDYGGFIDGIDWFDSKYFRINEKDAAVMDPQARVLLEESLNAIYDAGYDHKELYGSRTGVYIGARAQVTASWDSVLSAPNPILGVGQNYLATNVSRFFNLNGPSIVTDTACSSGITALQLASDALKSGRIDHALVGTSSLLLNSQAHDVFAARNILSTDGKFNIFDRKSSGEVLGEGVGIVVLKRLDDAIKDGNVIYGVIKAIAINNDGQTLGPGSPNIRAQKQVMEEALRLAGMRAKDVGYIEVNGGGSPIVDSVEIRALSDVYNLSDTSLPSCHIGSIKPNCGHMLLSSGFAGFIRCTLSVSNNQIPPYISTTDPFEHYDFGSSRIDMNRSSVAWKSSGERPRIAAQNCFPDGGTNCHVIVQEYIPDPKYRQRYYSKAAPLLNKSHYPIRGTSGERRDHTTNNIKKFDTESFWGGYEEVV